MTSKRGVLQIMLYVSTGFFVLGSTVIGLSFTKLPGKTLTNINKKLHKGHKASKIYTMDSASSYDPFQELMAYKKSQAMRTSIDIDVEYKNRKKLQDVQARQEKDYLILRLTKLKMDTDNKGTKYKSSKKYRKLIENIRRTKMDIEYNEANMKYEEFKAQSIYLNDIVE